jgi:hypothetical protein
MSSYRSRDQRIADEVSSETRMACRRCTSLSLSTMLAQYGGLCLTCFDAYCAEPSGARGFMTGRRDTVQQAEMRRSLKANRPFGQAVEGLE